VPSRLLTVGHGTATAEELSSLLASAGVEHLVDVRTAPGSRRHPQFRHEAMTAQLRSLYLRLLRADRNLR